MMESLYMMFRRFIIALQFLTILPVSVKSAPEKKDFGASILYFPLAGLLIGVFLALVALFLSFLSPIVRSTLLILASTAITGGIHLDGFADTCDGFYAGAGKEKILEIMRDSRIGTIAVIWVAILLLLKFSILAALPDGLLIKALVLSALFSRWAQGFACAGGVYARREGKAKYFIEYCSAADVLIGGVFSLCLFILLAGVTGVVIFFSAAGAVSLLLFYINKKIGGTTGDTIGAVSEIAEVIILICVVAAYSL